MCPDCEKTKSLKKLYFILVFMAVVVVGKTAFSADEHHKHKMGNEQSSTEMKREALDTKTQKSLQIVLDLNDKLHGAFFHYDESQIAKIALELKNAIDKIENVEIKKLLTYSQEKLAQMTKDSSREDNNKNYHLVSMALIHIVNKYDVGEKYNAYSCPMVKKKWLQKASKGEEINNPYAVNMPHCGSQI